MTKARIRCALVGLGYWGPNLARNLADNADLDLAFLCDRDAAALGRLARRYPQARATINFADILADPAVDAVFIATPPASHFALAEASLKSGRHVFVEKPLSVTSLEAEALTELAEKSGHVLMVDHIFVYSPAVAAIRNAVVRNDLGRILYYDSTRVNLGLFQNDVSVVWDLAVHDIAIMDHLLGETPTAISAVARSHVQGQRENLAYLTCFFEGSLIGHVHVNWLAPVKIRRTIIGGSQRMIIYDDLDLEQKVKIYDKGVDIRDGSYDLRVNYRSGDMMAPRIDATEALRTATAHFVECINHRKRPLTDGAAGLRVVRLLEAADRSIAAGGRPLEFTRR